MLFLFAATGIVQAQTDLVRWNLTANGNVSYSDASVIGDNFSTAQNPIVYNSFGALITGWNNPDVVHYRFVSISLSSSNGSPVDIGSLMFEHEATTNPPTNYTIRYYISPDGSVPSTDNFFNNLSSVLVSSESISANPIKSIPLNLTISGTQKLIIRFYTSATDYNNHGWRIKANTLKVTAPAAANPPEAINDNASTAQNFPVDVNILANDTYSSLSAITITQQPANGQNITVNGLTNVTYTPNTNYQGSDSFKYTITDENGTSNEATVNITINPVTAPTAVPDLASVIENQNVDINVLANDNQGSGAFDEVIIVSNPTNGTAIVNPNNTVKYTPNNSFSGSDSFQYQVTNIHNMTSNTVTVSINVFSTQVLVRWNNVDFSPTLVGSNISASSISMGGGVTLTHVANNSTENFFKTGNTWPPGGIDPEKYMEFTITPDAGYKIDLDQFNFFYKAEGTPQKLAIRYSKDNFTNYQTMIMDLDVTNSWTGFSNNLTSLNPILPSETLKVRIHLYNTYNTFYLKRMLDAGQPDNYLQTPTITGAVSSLSNLDLGVTKTVNNPTPTVNQNVVFTIGAINNGPNDATNVIVTDVLPNGYQFVSSNTATGSYNSGTGQWTIGSLANEATASLQITAKVLPTGSYANTATITSNQNDLVSANNTATVSVTPYFPSVDLKITKVANTSTPNAGSNVVFTLTAENLGPDPATTVVVTDLLPNGYAFVSSSPSVGNYNQISGAWTIGNLANSGTASLQITAKVLATGSYNNTATIASAETDPVPGNNTSTVNITPNIPSADLSITNTINNNNPAVNEHVTYTITVTNLGPDATTGVTVTDNIPSGFTYVSSSATVGSYNPGTGKWVIGSMAPSASETLTLTAQKLAAGIFTNIASVVHDGLDPESGNNSSSAGLALSCADCTHLISGGSVTVNPGEVHCLPSGTWSGGVIMNGGILCVSTGATLNASYTSGTFEGMIINNGTITAMPLSNNATHTVSIINWGTFTSAYLQNFAGTLHNYGTMTVTGGLETLSGSTIDNFGQLTIGTVSFYHTNLTNYNESVLTINNGVNVYSGYWDNKPGAEAYLNGGNINFTGDLDNAGYLEFERISSLSSTLNNYGHMKVHNAASNISSTTYLTNDSLLQFIDVPEIQYNGPMLTNNGTITVTHATTGNFKMNQAINQVFNNGVISVTGQFEQNAAGSLLVNNCTIECSTFFVGNGRAVNSGLVWASEDVSIQGSSSFLENEATGHVRGINFTNSGEISGYGAFYFTGTTNMNTSGSMIGGAPNAILFFDLSQTGNNIFDTPGGTVQNVMRPDTMEPMDTSSYDCTAPPSVAGYPPLALPFSTIICEPGNVLIPMAEYAEPHAPIEGDPFVLLFNRIRLFEFGNDFNPTNNSTQLSIADKGVLTADTITGLITFIPDPAFLSGIVEVEYRISNKRAGDPIVYPSARTKITITLINIDLPAITIGSGTNPVCLSQTLQLSNEVEGGVWSSSNESIATIDANGLVTPVAIGTTTISYTKTEESCSDTVTMEVTVNNCETPSSLLITNPMIRQRVTGGGDEL